MRTTPILNDGFIAKAFKHSSARTLTDLIHGAVEKLMAVRQRRDLRDLRGRVAFARGYGHKKLRREA